MTSSSRQQGQGTIEAMGATLIMSLVLIFGTFLILIGLYNLVLIKWASKVDHCVAETKEAEICKERAIHSLGNNFALRDISVKVRLFHGIIHSKIEGRFLGKSIKGSYDLEPSEYKRTQ